MRGQVQFFNVQRNFGILVAENGHKHYFSGRDWLSDEGIHRNEWCEFRSEVNANPGGTDFVAFDVQPIEVPSEHLLCGYVQTYFPEKKFGFIHYGKDSIFFHISDVLLIDGREYEPVPGCRVSFCLGQKTGRPIAAQIKILSWPEDANSPVPMFEVERYFESAPELPIDLPEPFTTPAPPESVLAPKNRCIPMIELIRRKQERKQR